MDFLFQKCFKRVDNANLTAERLRFRYRREALLASGAAGEEPDSISSIAVTNALTILDDDETMASTCPIPSLQHTIYSYCQKLGE